MFGMEENLLIYWKVFHHIFSLSSEMNVIDNQRILNQLSNKLEPGQT